MPRKSKKPVRKQTHSPTGKVVGQVGQILLPMIAGIAATKADLTEWVYDQGLTALHLLLREDAEEKALRSSLWVRRSVTRRSVSVESRASKPPPVHPPRKS